MLRLFLKMALSIFVGMFLFWLWTEMFSITYHKIGSLDIISGAIVEFFLFGLLLDLYHKRQVKIYKKELQDHLREIEKLIREK